MSKIENTLEFLAEKESHQQKFISFMKEFYPKVKSDRDRKVYFSAGIFPTQPHNSDPNIDLFDLVYERVSIEQYREALIKKFSKKPRSNTPENAAKEYIGYFEQLKQYLKHYNYI